MLFKSLFQFILFIPLFLYADDGTSYTPPSPEMPLNCASPSSQIHTVSINELYSGGGGEGYLEMVEIYFNQTTNITGWRFYFNDKNTHKYVNLGSGLGDVHYPDGSSGFDTYSTYPKGTFIVFNINGMDPTNGETFIANTTSSLSNEDYVIVDYFKYYKNSEQTFYILSDPACSVSLTNTNSNAKDISRLTDGSGDFYQYYPGTNDLIDVTTGSSNLANLPADSNLSANTSIQVSFNQTQAYSGDFVTLTLQVSNPSYDSITVTDVNVSNSIPNGLQYISNNGGTLLDAISPSNPFGTVTSTTPLFLWRLINGSVILSLPTDSTTEIDIVLQVIASAGTSITDTATLSTKQTNNGTLSDSDTLNIIALPAIANYFDAWDIFRDTNDKNISTKIANKPFELNISSLSESGLEFQEFNGTICTQVVDNHDNNLTNWNKIFFHAQSSTNSTFNITKASKNNFIKIAWGENVDENCPLTQETNRTIATDNFAVRPLKFSIEYNTTAFYAGLPFHIDLNATDFNNANTKNYAEIRNTSFVFDINDSNISCQSGVLGNLANQFSDGNISFDTNYSDIGDINFTLKEVENCTNKFAWVDCDDKNISGYYNSQTDLKIEEKSSSIIVSPYQFAIVDYDFQRNNPDDFWRYISDLNDSNITLFLRVQAQNKGAESVHKFDSRCYAQEVFMNIKLIATSQEGNVSYCKIVNNIKTTEHNKTLSDLNLSEIIHRQDFTDSKSSLVVYALNVYRQRDIAINPLDINVTDINTSYPSDIHVQNIGLRPENNGSTFYYGRVKTKDIITNQQSVQHSMEVEIYDTNESDSYHDNFHQNSLNWYHMQNDNYTIITELIPQKYFSYNEDENESHVILTPSNSLQIQGGDIYFDIGNNWLSLSTNTAYIHVKIPKYLWMNSYEDYNDSNQSDCASHPCFKYVYNTNNQPNIKSGDFNGSSIGDDYNATKVKIGVKVFR